MQLSELNQTSHTLHSSLEGEPLSSVSHNEGPHVDHSSQHHSGEGGRPLVQGQLKGTLNHGKLSVGVRKEEDRENHVHQQIEEKVQQL